MPNDTIEQRYQEGCRRPGNAVNYEYVTYEGYGPSGIAIIVECTDGQQEPYGCQCAQRVYKGTRQYRYTGLRILYV